MRYTVVWTPSARGELANIWVNAEVRAAVSRAANTIDYILRLDPLHLGESRAQGRRVLIELPLVVLYSVSEDDRLVTVRAVWYR